MLHVAQRVYNLLDELQEESAERTCILVAHNGIGRMVYSYFHEMDNEEFVTYGVKNGEILS